jgi:uncharacterized protein (TIGR03437 family)
MHDAVQVSIGGRQAAVSFAGLVSPGLYQVNVMVPDSGDGDQSVILTIDGILSQGGASINVRQ